MRDKRDRILIDGGISWQTDKLLERFPIQNTSEWEVDKTSNRYPMIVSKIAEPKCDPWNRPTLPWNFNQGDGKNNWTVVQWILRIIPFSLYNNQSNRNQVMAKEVIEINPNVHWYSLQELAFRFPLLNKRLAINDGSTAFEYFYDLDEHVETDPWNRKLTSWVRTQTEINDWLYTETKGTYYRLTSVQGKTVVLWMYPSPNHPLFK